MESTGHKKRRFSELLHNIKNIVDAMLKSQICKIKFHIFLKLHSPFTNYMPKITNFSQLSIFKIFKIYFFFNLKQFFSKSLKLGSSVADFSKL